MAEEMRTNSYKWWFQTTIQKHKKTKLKNILGNNNLDDVQEILIRIGSFN